MAKLNGASALPRRPSFLCRLQGAARSDAGDEATTPHQSDSTGAIRGNGRIGRTARCQSAFAEPVRHVTAFKRPPASGRSRRAPDPCKAPPSSCADICLPRRGVCRGRIICGETAPRFLMTRFPDANSSSLFASWRPAVAPDQGTGSRVASGPDTSELCLMNYPQLKYPAPCH